ncbi:CFI-box-CTERM domain-containing protein [Tundrisphaera lichenicola]|uniref:CFI-box-CTERM domain-containing protein n=1 Tax=Tundrisphaera lichenicola TaxID=2029860 RepID=UPI003EBA3CB6
MPDPIIVKGRPYFPMARAFFMLIADVAKPSSRPLPVSQLLRSLPIQYKTSADRTRLERRGDISKAEDRNVLYNERRVSTRVTLVQENFPRGSAGPGDQDILIEIPARVECQFAIDGAQLTLSFTGGSRPRVSFPGHPTLPALYLNGVFYNQSLCRITLESQEIVVDYTQDPDSHLKAVSDKMALKASTLKDWNHDHVVAMLVVMDMLTKSTRRTINGYYKIQKAKVVETNCDPEDQFCESSRCMVETEYEEERLEVADNATDEQVQQAIDEACRIRRGQIVDGDFDEVAVTWSSSGGTDMTTVTAGSGNCLAYATPDTTVATCFVVTAVYGQSDVLDTYYAFRDQVLLKSAVGRWLVRRYYQVGPCLAGFCRRYGVVKAAARFLLGGFHCLLRAAGIQPTNSASRS